MLRKAQEIFATFYNADNLSEAPISERLFCKVSGNEIPHLPVHDVSYRAIATSRSLEIRDSDAAIGNHDKWLRLYLAGPSMNEWLV